MSSVDLPPSISVIFNPVPAYITFGSTQVLSWNITQDGDLVRDGTFSLFIEAAGGSGLAFELAQIIPISNTSETNQFSWVVNVPPGTYFALANSASDSFSISTSSNAFIVDPDNNTSSSSHSITFASEFTFLTSASEFTFLTVPSEFTFLTQSTLSAQKSATTSFPASTSSSHIPAETSIASASGPTNNDSSSKSVATAHHSVDLSAAVGGAVGGIVALLLILSTVYIILRRRKHQKYNAQFEIEEREEMEEAGIIEPFFAHSRTELLHATATSEDVGQLYQLRDSQASVVIDNVPGDSKSNSYSTETTRRPAVNTDTQRDASGNQDVLSNQMVQMRQALERLEVQLQSASRINIPPAQSNNTRFTNDSDLQQRILTLQAEIEQLQRNQEELIRAQNSMDRLPEYDETIR